MRERKDTTLLKFLYHFIPAIIGSEMWKEKQCSTNISDPFTVSNEVFLFFTIENNFDQWNSKQTNNVSTTTQAMIFRNDDELTFCDFNR